RGGHEMTLKDSQDIDLQKEGKLKFHRGSALSIFASDRREDFIALVCSLLIALGVYVFVG
ncbi:MAG: hypothetical protein OQK07_02620, partial [Rhodospirillales bacterium]|nr:hypothetical protein [Rhodospirillales bacterium]